MVSCLACYAQEQKGIGQNDDVIILNDKTIIIRANKTLNYIGEIKGRSYIRIILDTDETPTRVDRENESDPLHYKGTCYEAASNKSYSITASYLSESQTWDIRCYNSRKQYVSNFHGRETSEGTIEGTWKNKHKAHTFYLFKKENKS